jgi:Trk K+ transport system NAD-binding subunit
MMRTLDAGTMGGDTGWHYRFVMFGVTIGGVFIISTLIGVLSNGLEDRMGELRKGRSRVIERNHVVILGWSEQVFTILREISQANGNRSGQCVVLLGEKDKVEIEDQIRERVNQDGVRFKTRFVCRKGSSIDGADLAITNLNQARSIIIVSPQDSEGDAENRDAGHRDAEVIKTVLAILNSPNRRAAPYHIVAELRDPHNFTVAQVVGRGEVEWILVGDLVARVIAQTCRQSGLSLVYGELLDFEGVEMYFTQPGDLVGLSFGEALLRFENNILMGMTSQNGPVKLNPPMDTIINPGDRLVVIALDNQSISTQGADPGRIQTEYLTAPLPSQPLPERTLLLGWNWRAPPVLRELDYYVPAGSLVKVVANMPDFENRVITETTRGTSSGPHNLSIQALQADTTDRAVLESLDLGSFNHVIVLCYLENISAQQADARTLITLLHLRDLADIYGWTFSVTSEMLDVRNRELADITRADDFIVSDRMVSLLLTQVSENKELNAVFTDLFNSEGSEIYLKPAENYIQPGVPVNFYTVVESARRQGEVALGYRILARNNAAHGYGVTLNPSKSAAMTFAPGDRIIVLAEK